MPAKKTFEQFFNDELSEVLRPLEDQRRAVSQLAFASGMLGILGGILFFIGSSGSGQGAVVLGIVVLLAAGILFAVYYNKKNTYVSDFKEKIIRRTINFIDPTLTYKPGECVNEKDYDRSGLFLREVDSYEGDDYVEGRRDKTFFCFSELHTQHREGSGKNTHWENIFQGLFFIGDFNKNFSGRTYVWSEQNPQLDFFSKLFSSFSRDLEKIKLESTEFEKRFIVYSNDQVESRYILTPSFMERLMKLQDMMGSHISFSFVNTNINVAVPIRDKLFEPSIFSANDYQSLGDYYNTLHIVFDIIDELQLNQRLWNKE